VKIVIEKPLDGEEEQVIVKCHNINPELLDLLNSLKAQNILLIAYASGEIHRIPPADVLYIETVDNKTFLYCAHNIYESKQKLYELEEFNLRDFMRVSKSAILNLSKVKSLVPSMSGKIEAVLVNGERVIISRFYVGALKKNLGI